jgi:hypothetical protein
LKQAVPYLRQLVARLSPQIKPLEENMILHILEVMYQKMEEHVRMWKPESRRPEELLLD